VDQTQVQYIDCSAVPLTYGTRLVDDVLNRTETSASQAMTFLAMELGVEAESQAKRVTLEDVPQPGGSD